MTLTRPSELSPAELRDLANEANRDLENASAQEIMRWAHDQFGTKLAIASSMSDTVLIHLTEQTAPGTDAIFLDTGYHFAETIGTRDAAQQVYDVNVINVVPEHTVAEQDSLHGKDLFARDPDLCCQLRKVEPLNRALAPYVAWATGVRRADGPGRANTPVVSYDLRKHMIKIAPIARWSDDDVANYIEENQLIVNPLLEDGYTSIGCEPCTSKATSDDPRSGRWAGLGKTECGIQV